VAHPSCGLKGESIQQTFLPVLTIVCEGRLKSQPLNTLGCGKIFSWN